MSARSLLFIFLFTFLASGVLPARADSLRMPQLDTLHHLFFKGESARADSSGVTQWLMRVIENAYTFLLRVTKPIRHLALRMWTRLSAAGSEHDGILSVPLSGRKGT
jgi:hypothetical protein